MANVLFKKGLLAGLNAAPKVAGTIYVTTDERAMYLDVDDSTRIRLGDFIEVTSIDDLPVTGANPNALYYVKGTSEKPANILAKWDPTGGENGDGKWIQINPDNFYRITDFTQTVAAVANGVKINTSFKEIDEAGKTANTFNDDIKIISGSDRATVEVDTSDIGSRTIKITTKDEKVSSAANHYKAKDADASAVSTIKASTGTPDALVKKIIESVNVDAAGHVTSLTVRSENDLKSQSIEVATTGNTAKISSTVTSSAGTPAVDDFSIAGGSNVTVSSNGKVITIAAKDEVATKAGHYDPTEDSSALIEVANKQVISQIKRDDNGHVTGVETRSENDINGVNVNVVGDATNNKATVKTNVSTKSTTVGVEDSFVIQGVNTGVATTEVTVESDGTLKIAADGVSSVEKHYTPSAAGAIEVKGSNKFITGITKDAAGHIVGVTSEDAVQAVLTSNDLTFAAGTGNSAKLKSTVKQGSAAEVSDDTTIIGGDHVTVTVGNDSLTISSTDDSVTSVDKHYGYASTNPDAHNASDSASNPTDAASSAKAQTDVVTGVKVDKAGHVTGVTSIKLSDTHANVSTFGVTPVTTTDQQDGGWRLTVEDTDHDMAIGYLDPVIKLGVPNSDTRVNGIHSADGAFDLNVYTIPETDAKIKEVLGAANAMNLAGNLAGADAQANATDIPLTKLSNGSTVAVEAGDTFIVTVKGWIDGVDAEGNTPVYAEPGDLFVAKIDNPTGGSNFYYVPSGNDNIILKIDENSDNYVGVKLTDGNITTDGPTYGSFGFDNTESDSLIKVTAVVGTAGAGQKTSFSINMEWGSF